MKYTLFILLLFFSLSIVYAEECPLGMVNDTAPGQCVLYTDNDANEICDLSEPHNCTADENINNPVGIELTGTQLKAMTVAETAQAYGVDKELLAAEIGKLLNINVKPTDSLQILHDNNQLGMADVKAIASSLSSTQVIGTKNILPQPKKTNYYLLPIVLITTLIYVASYLLVKFKVITYILHKKIWNWLLLISFLATAVLAIIWIINAEYTVGIRLPINTSYWHIVTGIVMILISIFHVLWHLNYYFIKRKT